MRFTQVLNELMESRNLSSYRLAKESGIPEGMVGFWRRGERIPSAENLIKLADYFNVSLDYLVGRSDDRGTVQPQAEDDDDDFAYAALDGGELSETQIKSIKELIKAEIEREKKGK